jgi:anti-anti-sigma factor
VAADDDGTRVTLVGEIDMGCQPELDAAADTVLRRPAEVTVDLGRTEFLASCGVEFLVRLYNGLDPHGHTVTLLDPSRVVRRVLEITGVDQRMTISSSAETDTC